MMFGKKRMRRNFIYTDDVAAGIIACVDTAPEDDDVVKAAGSISSHRVSTIWE